MTCSVRCIGRVPAIVGAVACLAVGSCSSGGESTIESGPVASSGGSVSDSPASGDPVADGGATVVEPAEMGPLTEFELGGLTLAYDSSYWEIQPLGPDDPDDALVWFASEATNAAVQISFTNEDMDPERDVCAAGYGGDLDPSRHAVTLLHEETLSNGGLLTIYEQDLDTWGDDAVVGISYAQLTFNPDAGRDVGDSFCQYDSWIDVSPRTRDDGSPVYYRVQAFFAFTIDFIFAPFKERFDSADALRQHGGFREILALLETIELAGSAA